MRKHYIVCDAHSYKQSEEVLKYPYLLFSYLTFQKNPSLINIYKNNEILLDSGVFTFLNNKRKLNINYDDYLIEYANFIKKYKIKQFIELDLYKFLGVKKVLEFRSILEKIVGYKCIPVWHNYLSINELNNMINNYDYIAIGGFVNHEIKKNDYPKIKNIIDYCNSKNVKVHLLGRSLETVEKHNFNNYSQDSIKWKSTIYRAYYCIENNKLICKVSQSKFKLKRDEIENNNLKIFKYYMGIKGYGK